MPDKPAEEFFYLDEDGNKQDSELHGPIINPVDFPIDEKIMAPIRARHRAAHQAKTQETLRKRHWRRVKQRTLALLQNGQSGLYRRVREEKVWNEADHPREPAGSSEGGQFAGGGSADTGKPDAGPAEGPSKPAKQSPRAFDRESAGDDQRSRGVVAIHRPTAAAAEKMRAAGNTPQTFYEFGDKAGAKSFENAITRAKAESKYGAAVYVYDANSYEKMRLFMAPDGRSGFALKGDEIVSLFKHPSSTANGVADVALELASEQGGRRLDAFDTQLPYIYADSGFVAVARLKWDETQKPDGWDKETFKEFNDGEPDVVFMVDVSSKPQSYSKKDGRYVKDYDEGVAAQQDHSRAAKDPTSASSLLKIERVTVEELYQKVPGSKEQAAEARRKLAEDVPTDATYKLPSGKWAPERAAVHRQIVEKLMTPEQIAAATPEPGEQPTLYILGGRGGSGKGWFMDARKGGTLAQAKEKALYINSDDVKSALPEYQGWNAALLHEESSYVGTAMETYARDNRLNMIVDATLKSESTTDMRIALAKAAGYKISGHYMYASPATAAERALGRFVRGNETNGNGRFVLPEYSLGSVTNETSFDKHRADMDYWEVYDNMGDKPNLHARKSK